MVKLFDVLRKVVEWLKANWKLVLISLVIAIGAYILVRAQLALNSKVEAFDELFQQYKAQSQDFQRQLDDIQRVYERDREAREELEARFQANREEAERLHAAILAKLERDRRSLLSRILQEYEDNPNTLTERFREVFGIPIYTTRDAQEAP